LDAELRLRTSFRSVSPKGFEDFDYLLEGIPMHAKAALEVLRRQSLSYGRVHHQDAYELLCPDVFSFLAAFGKANST
jgi:hypothetical protein